MHKVPKRKLGPRRCDKCNASAGNSQAIKNLGDSFVSCEEIDNRQNKRNTANMKRQIAYFPQAYCGGTDILEKFIYNKQNADNYQHSLSSLLTKFFKKQSEPCNYKCGNHKLNNMKSAKELKADTVGDAVLCMPKITKIHFYHLFMPARQA